MLKRNFEDSQNNPNGSQHEGEPQAKRLNSASPVEPTSNSSSRNGNAIRIQSPNDQDPLGSQTVLAGMLEKTPVDKTSHFDNVLDYFDKKLGELGVSNKPSSGGKSNISSDADLPQMIMNPKARMKAEIMKNPPDVIPVSDQKLRSPPSHQGPKAVVPASSVTPSSDRCVKAERESNAPNMTLPQTPKTECCIIENLTKRFHPSGIRKLSENELLTLIDHGRPTPDIPILGVTKNLYDHHLWITGCPTLERLYCWTCLVFVERVPKAANTAWLKEGFRNMNMLGTSMTKHLTTVIHQNALDHKNHLIRKGLIPNHSTGEKLQDELANAHVDWWLPSSKPVASGRTQSPKTYSKYDEVTKQTLTPKTPNTTLNPTVSHSTANQGTILLDTNNQETLHRQNPEQHQIYDLTQSDDYDTPSSKMIDLSRLRGSLKERLTLHTEYRMLMEQQRMKASAHTGLLTNPSSTSAAKTKTQLTPGFDVSALQLEYFPNGTFTGTEAVREQIIAVGRPTPEMPGLAMTLGLNGGMEYFNKSYYQEFPWMCGSREMNRLYCWPCLVFNDHTYNNTWNTVGINTLANLPSVARMHSLTQPHLELSIRLKMVEGILKSKSQTTEAQAKHNESVRQKQLLLKYLIDAVCFKKKLLNNVDVSHEDFNGYLTILSAYDTKLKTLLDPESKHYMADFTPTVAERYSSDVIQALTTILKRKIAAEVEKAAYVSFILRTVRNNLVALIVRYAESTGVVHERFYKLFQIGFGLQDPLLKLVFTEVNDLRCSAKFVGISYDGGCLRPDQMESFNSKMRSGLMAAYFFHYRDDDLNILLQQSLSHTLHCRSFFQLVMEFRKFWSDNPQVQRSIGKMTSRDTPNWGFDSGIILTIRQQYSAIMQFLTQVAGGFLARDGWSNHMISQCKKFATFFGIRETRLLIVLFSKVHQCIQNISLHPPKEAAQGEFHAKYWKYSASAAYSIIYDMKVCRFVEALNSAEGMIGGTVLSVPNEDRGRLMNMYNDTIEWILALMKYRTKYIDVWSYFDFSTINADSPIRQAKTNQTQFVMDLKECFPLFDAHKLCSAMIFANKDPRFRDKSAAEITQLMIKWDFKSVLPELFSYLLLIQAVPLSSAHVSSPISGRLATYVEGKTQLTPEDALLHLEKDLLASARNEENFYNDVLNIIAEQRGTESDWLSCR